MKKIVAIIIMNIILFQLTIVYATNSTVVQFKGKEKVQPGETNTIVLQMSNDEAVGVIEGIISFDSGIKDLKVSSSYNGWAVTYNESTGKIIAIKEEGSTKDETLKITYKLNENFDKGTITLKDVKLTTISYKILELENDIYITITPESKVVEEPESSGTENETNNITNNTINNVNNNMNVVQNIVNSNKTNVTTETVNVSQTNSQISSKDFPKAGIIITPITIAILIAVIVVVILYKKQQYYKTI